MMPENYPAIRADKVPAIIVNLAGSGATVIGGQAPRGDPLGIKAVADDVGTKRRQQKVGGTDVLAASQRQSCVGECPKQGHARPQHFWNNSAHVRPAGQSSRCRSESEEFPVLSKIE